MEELELKGRTLGEFILLEEIGRGAYGVVYRAEQPGLGRDVVVKVLYRTDEDAERRFLREARLASALDHPYAAHVYAFGGGDSDTHLWIAMEFVKGLTLTGWLKAHGPMTLEQFVPFFEHVAEVVTAAHDRGIIHRDLKPSNIMVLEHGGRLVPKLLDLGVAKWTQDGLEKWNEAIVEATRTQDAVSDSNESGEGGDITITPRIGGLRRVIQLSPLTRMGAVVGSLPYMSPEQFRNSGAESAASDLYALGIITYEVLTGSLPFAASNPDEYRKMHLEAEPPRLSLPRIDAIIQQALSKYPEMRQRSALDMARQLREALLAEPLVQLRSLAGIWYARQQPPSLLLRDADLLRVEEEAQTQSVGEIERAFVAESQKHCLREASLRAQQVKNRRRGVWSTMIALLVMAVLLVWAHLAHRTELAQEEARYARRIAEVTIVQAELEQGRSGLLHGEPDAAVHLGKAYRRDHAPMTAFMLARALQSRLAEQARMTSSSGRMWSGTFSPDGTRALTSDDKNAQIWDADRLLLTLPHGDTVYYAAYSADGKRIITASGDGTVKIWDSGSGTVVRELTDEHRTARYRAAATSGKLVAAIDLVGAVTHVWDVESGGLLTQLHNDTSTFSSVAFSADGRWLATSGGDVRVFDTRTWATVLAIPGSWRLAWDPAGSRLLTGSPDGDVSLWDLPSGKKQHHLRDVGEAIDAVAFSPNGQLVVTASHDGAVQVWDTMSGKLRSQGNYLRTRILSVEFDPTSTLIAAAGSSGAVAVTDVSRGLVSLLEGPQNTVVTAHFDASSRRVIGASWDGTVRVWEVSAPYRQWSTPQADHGCGVITDLEPERRFLAVGCEDLPTRVWDTSRGQLIAELPSVTPSGNGFASALPALSAGADRAAIARGKTVEIYELPAGKLLRSVEHSAAVNTVAFSSTGRDLVSGAVDGSVLVTRDNGSQLALPKSSGGIDVAGFLSDGRVVVSDAQQRLRVYDVSGALVADLKTSARATALRIAGRNLVILPRFAGRVAPPELWDVERYRVIAQLDAPGQGRVSSARFLQGSRVVTAGADGAARLWDTSTGQLLQTYKGGSRALNDVTTFADGSMIVGGDSDGLLRFWDATSGRPLWTMPAHRSLLVGVRVEGNDIITRGYSGEIARWTLPKPERIIAACGEHKHCATVLQ